MYRNNFIIESRAGIGDLLHLLPLIQNIRIAYPKSKISVVTSQEEVAAILKMSGSIDDYYSFDGIKKIGVCATLKQILSLRKNQFDTGIIDPIANYHRWWVIMKLWGCKEIIYVDNKKDNVEIQERFGRKSFAVLKKMTIPIKERIAYIDKSVVDNVLENVKKDFLREINSLKLVGVCIRDSLSARDLPYNITQEDEPAVKILPMSTIIELVNKLTTDGYQVALLGGKNDTLIVEEYYHKLIEPQNTLNLVGKLGLQEMMAVMRCCNVIIGGDFGIIHLADTIGVSTLVYYGSTSPDIVGPFSSKATKITANLSCQYCFHVKEKILCKEKNCIKYLTSEFIYQEFQKKMQQEEGKNEDFS